MKTITPIAAFASVIAIGAAALASPASLVRAATPTAITWAATPGGRVGTPTVDFRYETSNTAIALTEAADLGAMRGALAREGAVSFRLVRDPGVLECDGATTQAFTGSGTCTFVPDAAFERDMAARSLAPEDREELLAMALLRVDRAMIDGLIAEGLSPDSADEVIAAAALDVTPEYVAGLKTAGLALRDVADAVACRAIGVDAAYVRGLVEAGYRPDPHEIVAMRAVGVTPDYARRMAAATQQ